MKKILVYLLVTFGFGWMCQGFAVLSLRIGLNSFIYTALLALCMFAPLLGTLAGNGGIGRKAGLLWKPQIKGRSGWWLAAWFGPALLSALGTGLFFLLFPARFDASMPILSAQLGGEAASFPVQLAALVALVQSVTYAPFINMLFALGEEVGWRGWMTPALTKRFGQTKGLVLSGIIWGLWHWPIIFLAGYNFGTGYWGAPFTGGLEMCLACIALGVLLSLLYEKTRSILAPALAHGALNAAAGLGSFFLPAETTSTILGPTPLGLVAGLPLFALALLVLLRKPTEKEPE